MHTKLRIATLRWVRRAVSLSLCHPFPQTITTQSLKKLPWPTTSLLGERENGTFTQGFWPFRVLPKGLFLSCLTWSAEGTSIVDCLEAAKKVKDWRGVGYYSGPGSLRCGEITQPWDVSTRRQGEEWSMYPMSWFQPTVLKTKGRWFTVGGTTLQDWDKAHNPKTSPLGGSERTCIQHLSPSMHSTRENGWAAYCD